MLRPSVMSGGSPALARFVCLTGGIGMDAREIEAVLEIEAVVSA